MKRIVVSAALILLIAGSLARDESWTTAGYAAMLRHMEQLEQDTFFCDCAAPSPECVEHCNAEPGPGWICGWHVDEMDRLLREALIRGDRPDVIEELIRRLPAPFSREVLVKIRPSGTVTREAYP